MTNFFMRSAHIYACDAYKQTKKDRPEPYYFQGFERFSFIYAVP